VTSRLNTRCLPIKVLNGVDKGSLKGM